ncbi:MAG: hypothetical protein IPH23_02260 [Gammaproteobacteria bacterium]|nr:hypothetical protein [Gammaproteobacteria bacterium]
MSQRDKATLEALIQSRAGAGWRLIPPANYHLTLCFLGGQLPATLALAPFPTPAAPERSAAMELGLSFNELCVFQSIPTPTGRRYERLDSLALGTDGTPPEGGASG